MEDWVRRVGRDRERESTAIVQFRRVEPIFLSADPIGLRKHYA